MQGTPSTIIVVKWKNVAVGRLESNKVFWYDASSWRVTRLSGMMKLERDKVFWYDASS